MQCPGRELQEKPTSKGTCESAMATGHAHLGEEVRAGTCCTCAPAPPRGPVPIPTCRATPCQGVVLVGAQHLLLGTTEKSVGKGGVD